MAIAWRDVPARFGLRTSDAPPTARETAFGRAAIVVLAIEWVVFGSMHFSFPEATIAQLPDLIPGRRAIVIVSGMLEVAVGLLVLPQRTRRRAALASLALLAVYVLPVYNILSDPAALALLPAPIQAPFRLVLVPNNLFLAICSIFLFEHPGLRLLGPPAAPATPATLPRRSAARTGPHERTVLLVALLFFACNTAGFVALVMGVRAHSAEAALWAMALLAIGALFGFLFGVPKLNRTLEDKDRLLPNTNVEEVSDWLTKIVVGVSLVNFTTIGTQLGGYAARMARSLAVTDTFAAAMLAYFATLGAIEGYILTRLFLARAFGDR